MRIQWLSEEKYELFEQDQRAWLATLADASRSKALQGASRSGADPSPSLSPTHRYRLLWFATDRLGKVFGDRVAVKARHLKGRRPSARSAAKYLNEWERGYSSACVAAVEVANEICGINNGRHGEEAFSRTFRGREALHNFLLWLRGVPEFGDGLDLRKDVSRSLAEAGREKEIAAVHAFLVAKAGRQSEPAIMVVHADGMTRGLTALANHVIDHPDFATSPICYLPVSHMAGTPDIVDAPRLVGWLHNFYHGRRSGDPEGPTRASSEAGFIEMVEDIRREMARKPAIIILDGHIDRVGGSNALRNIIVDDAVTGVLEMLVQPHGGSAETPSDISVFEKTCFLVLSDGPAESLAPYCSKRISFPGPQLVDTLRFLHDSDSHGGPLFDYPEAVEAYCKATNCSNEIEMHLVDVLASRELPFDDIAAGQPEKLVARLLKSLRDEDTRNFLIVTWLALTPGGLRYASLHRLLTRWGKIFTSEDGEGLAVCPSPFQSSLETVEDDVEGLVGYHDGLFIEVEDQTLSATMLQDHRLEDLDARLDPESDDRRSPRRDKGRATITFRLPRMRRLFLQEILKDEMAHDVIAAMHFLLAEESLRQHTMLMRHAERMDFSSMRANRRLCQALYHGFFSLKASPALRERVVTRIPCVLPAPIERAFIRLYAIFYRNLLEAPPHWEVSRVMGADPVKRDLLLLALNAISDEPNRWRKAMLDDIEQGLTLPKWILDAASRASADGSESLPLVETMADLLVALGHAAEQLGEIDLVHKCGRIANDLDSQVAPAVWRVSGLVSQRFRRAKIEIDAHISASKTRDAEQQIGAALLAIGFEGLRDRARELAEKLDGGEITTWEALDKTVNAAVEPVSAEHLAMVADLLARQAEVFIPKPLQEVGQTAPTGEPGDRLLLWRTFILLKMAVACRRLVAWRQPLGRSYVASGHWSRTYIRITLLILQLQERQDLYKRPALDRIRLFQEMRKEADVLVRYFSRYPAERASLLVVEAMIVNALTKTREGLKAAHRLILEADERLTWATDRPRLRMRLLYERALILVARAAAISREDVTAAKVLLAAALFDRRRLVAMAETNPSTSWREWAADIDTSVEILSQELDR